MNLPGFPEHDPRLPWVSKVVRFEDAWLVAADFITFVHDIRHTGPGAEWVWQVARRIACVLIKLGIQEACRKRRPPAQLPGAWAGSVAKVENRDTVLNEISQDKWDKSKVIVSSLLEVFRSSVDGMMDFKRLLSDRGFLVHVSLAYPMLVPYLKGIHQTADSWRKDRRADGWKMSDSQWRDYSWLMAEKLGIPVEDLTFEKDAPSR
eukprot:scaffold163017_cov34-Attheya_sp.AAC.1